MTPDEVAAAYECARYEQLRGQTWADLREGERTARLVVARKALDDSGITAVIEHLHTRAERADELTGILAQRDAEIARRGAEHDIEIARRATEHDEVVARRNELVGLLAQRESQIARLRSDHNDEVTGLEATIAGLSADLANARTEAARAHAEADHALGLVAAIRAVLATERSNHPVDHLAPGPSTGDVTIPARAEDRAAPPVTLPPAKGRFSRRSRSDAALA